MDAMPFFDYGVDGPTVGGNWQPDPPRPRSIFSAAAVVPMTDDEMLKIRSILSAALNEAGYVMAVGAFFKSGSGCMIELSIGRLEKPAPPATPVTGDERFANLDTAPPREAS